MTHTLIELSKHELAARYGCRSFVPGMQRTQSSGCRTRKRLARAGAIDFGCDQQAPEQGLAQVGYASSPCQDRKDQEETQWSQAGWSTWPSAAYEATGSCREGQRNDPFASRSLRSIAYAAARATGGQRPRPTCVFRLPNCPNCKRKLPSIRVMAHLPLLPRGRNFKGDCSRCARNWQRS